MKDKQFNLLKTNLSGSEIKNNNKWSYKSLHQILVMFLVVFKYKLLIGTSYNNCINRYHCLLFTLDT